MTFYIPTEYLELNLWIGVTTFAILVIFASLMYVCGELFTKVQIALNIYLASFYRVLQFLAVLVMCLQIPLTIYCIAEAMEYSGSELAQNNFRRYTVLVTTSMLAPLAGVCAVILSFICHNGKYGLHKKNLRIFKPEVSLSDN